MTKRSRARKFADEGAEAVFRGFEALPAELQYRLLGEIEQGLTQEDSPPTTLERRVHRALRSLNEAYTVLGGSLSMKRYERARREHPERDWTSASSIKRALGAGSWEDALRRAQLPV